MSDQPAEQPPAQAGADRAEDIDARFGKIEHEQARQGGLLEEIRVLVKGGGPAKGAHDAAQARTEDHLEHPPAETVAEQVRKAVQDVKADEARERQAQEHDDHHRQIREQAERPPHEQASGARGRLQRVMFGAEPK